MSDARRMDRVGRSSTRLRKLLDAIGMIFALSGMTLIAVAMAPRIARHNLRLLLPGRCRCSRRSASVRP